MVLSVLPAGRVSLRGPAVRMRLVWLECWRTHGSWVRRDAAAGLQVGPELAWLGRSTSVGGVIAARALRQKRRHFLR